MAPQPEKSQLKRNLQSVDESEAKKPRRSHRLSQGNGHGHGTPLKPEPLPSPVTHQESTGTDNISGRSTPPSQMLTRPTKGISSPSSVGLSSPPSDTQVYSQFVPPNRIAYEVDDEKGQGVWGYLVPLSGKTGDTLVLRERHACPVPCMESAKSSNQSKKRTDKKDFEKEEEEYEKKKVDGIAASGYLVGRHPECDRRIDSGIVSNRHCLVFPETKGGRPTAILEDLSANGTYINDALVGRNKRQELESNDKISILDEAHYVFKYPRTRFANGFGEQYVIQEQLGKGHFASVYMCVEKNTGSRYAVKIFEKRARQAGRSGFDGLQQEIAVLMSVSHPSLLCLKGTFDEEDGVYLILELAPEGELFNCIVMKQKLSEDETRKVFIQLFQAVKYLHERNIVHRDIKPENILLTDKHLNVKLADFGLAKIIGEESFTTTLCGTPSYVAPEILENSNHRRYTRAVDVWSLGVVLYICLCGFPPFSDELYSPENPYTLSQQIKTGRFDFPSPYWDTVGDPALDLIDRMLTVDMDQRFTIDECLEHPWITQRQLNPNDSTDGLTSAFGNINFSKRKVQRERTLLSSINDVRISKVIECNGDNDQHIKVYEKNHASQTNTQGGVGRKEVGPSANRKEHEFVEMGGKGDVTLFGGESSSIYPSNTVAAEKPSKPAAGKKAKK